MKILRLSFLFLFLISIPLDLAAARPRAKPPKPKADRILIEKAARQMTLFQGEETLKVYRISLGREPVGPKREEGDGKTPEGRYKIDGRNPNSAFHLSLRISYPNVADRAQANERGVKPGGQIMIHGLPNGMPDFGGGILSDWTDGCVAVSNAEIEEIWKLVPNGAAVEILP
ncbi:MAG TPA: L,D-transpeptidase family protein [bacterium]|nr:L,D-transpeptidase family protein [bacterium]